MQVALPIVGVRQKLSEGAMGQIEREVLEKEHINLENMAVNPLSRVSGKGGLRTAAAPVRNFVFQLSECIDGNGCQGELSFMLQRGCYATVLLRETMKPADPLTAGF